MFSPREYDHPNLGSLIYSSAVDQIWIIENSLYIVYDIWRLRLSVLLPAYVCIAFNILIMQYKHRVSYVYLNSLGTGQNVRGGGVNFKMSLENR